MDKKTPIEQQWKHGKLKDLCIDFDGVIHSYKSGWKGATVIPDEPVKGAIEWLVGLLGQGFQPCIYSSRSRSWFGRRAMKKWLFDHLLKEMENIRSLDCDDFLWHEDWRWKVVDYHQSMDPWDVHVYEACKVFINRIQFSAKKPAAYLTLDDRAICFNGTFPTAEEMNNFKPWYKIG